MGTSGGQAGLAAGALCQGSAGKQGFEASPPTEGPFIGTLAITLLSSIMQPETRRQTKKSVEKYHIDPIQYARH